MADNARTLSGRFSLKRSLLLVLVVEVVLAAALTVYWTRFRDEFFPYPVNDDGTVTVTGEPLLVGYGRPVAGPWTFSDVGADTLRLNGLPFLPMREHDSTLDLEPGDRDRLLTIKAILAEAETAYQTAADKDAGMTAFGDVLADYLGLFVDSASIDREHEQITVDFVDDLPPFTVTFLQDPHWIEPEGARRNQHYELIEEFIVWMEGNDADAVFSFGPSHTELVVGRAERASYEAVLAGLDGIEREPHGRLSAEDVRRSLGDEVYGRWEPLIRDYLGWSGMHDD